jgi:serine/threonine-protein kinase
MTKTNAVLGSPHFMSPEQMIATRDVDPRTDIWSLGVILYQLTTGKFPFPGRSATEIISVIYTKRPDPPSHLAPHLPPAFDDIVMRCLRLDAAERYGSVADLAAALAPLAPPSASFTLERIAGYAMADARITGSAMPAPAGSAEDQSDRSPWPAVGMDPMADSMSSAPTNVLNVASKTEVLPAGIPGAPRQVSLAAPNHAPVDDSMSAAATRVLQGASNVRARNDTLVMPLNADASSSGAGTGSTKKSSSLSHKGDAIAAVIAAVVIGLVALAVSLLRK